MIERDAMQCGTVECGTVQFNIVYCDAILCGAVQRGAMRCGAVQYSRMIGHHIAVVKDTEQLGGGRCKPYFLLT